MLSFEQSIFGNKFIIHFSLNSKNSSENSVPSTSFILDEILEFPVIVKSTMQVVSW